MAAEPMQLPYMTMMAWSRERTPTAARLMPKTDTALEDCTSAVRNAATRKASASESPVPASMSRNQGSSASGAAASLRRTSPMMIMAPRGTTPPRVGIAPAARSPRTRRQWRARRARSP